MNTLRYRLHSLKAVASLSALSLAFACGGTGEDDATTDSGAGGAVAVGGSGVTGGAGNVGGTNSGGATNSGGNTPGNGGGLSTGGSASGGGIGSGGVVIGGGGQIGSGGGDGGPVTCNITVLNSAPSGDMGSVGVVEFSTDLPGVTSAAIHFGETTSYGIEAPVDLAEANYRTTLLGLPFQSPLNYQIVVQGPSGSCTSENQMMTLGPQPNGVSANVSVEGTGTEEGYLVSAVYNGGVVFISNMQGDLVWVRDTSLSDVSQTRISPDGKYVYARNGNPGGGLGGQLIRLTVDGSSSETIPSGGSHHDMAFLPNGDLLYIRKSDANPSCDAIMQLTPDGSESVLLEFADALPSFNGGGGGDGCHVNAVRYSDVDQTVTVGSRNLSTMVNFNLDGSVNWIAGGQDSTLNQNGLTWTVQHGIHMPDPSTIYFFNNDGNSQVGDGQSIALKATISGGNMTLDSWFFDSTPHTFSQGDVQELPNGNVLVTFSNNGVANEVDPSGNSVKTYNLAGGVGYITYRTSLYGMPAR